MTAELVAFVATTDLEAAGRFYGEALGLREVERSEFAAVFDANGTELRVTLVQELQPAPYTVLGWRVDDLDRRLGELRRAGITPRRYGYLEQDDRGVWTTPDGTEVVWFSDPDGNTLSLHQPAA